MNAVPVKLFIMLALFTSSAQSGPAAFFACQAACYSSLMGCAAAAGVATAGAAGLGCPAAYTACMMVCSALAPLPTV